VYSLEMTQSYQQQVDQKEAEMAVGVIVHHETRQTLSAYRYSSKK